LESNPQYGKWKQGATDFKANQNEQLIIQNHSAHQFQDFVAPRILGKQMLATDYQPTNKRTGGFNKQRMSQLHKEANNVEALSAHNRALNIRRPQPTENPSIQN
jgi:dTDP-4-dehydrorhamnose 3,5-epimerase-like enzyme